MFGQAKNMPLVTDFDGNGHVDISICPNDRCLIDSNGIWELDEPHFDIPDFGERVAYGDWNGDG